MEHCLEINVELLAPLDGPRAVVQLCYSQQVDSMTREVTTSRIRVAGLLSDVTRPMRGLESQLSHQKGCLITDTCCQMPYKM